MSRAIEHTCASCGLVFAYAWTESDALMEYQQDADALMEYQQVFTEEERAMDDSPPVRVCEDCYRKAMLRVHLIRLLSDPPRSPS